MVAESFKFNGGRTCPECQAAFDAAERQSEYDPLVVVVCPQCGALLWRPGSDESSALFKYDPDADAGGF